MLGRSDRRLYGLGVGCLGCVGRVSHITTVERSPRAEIGNGLFSGKTVSSSV